MDDLIRNETASSRKLGFDCLGSMVEYMKGEVVGELTLYYFLPVIQFLIDFREEDIQDETISTQFASYSLHLSQFEYDQHAFPIVLHYAR